MSFRESVFTILLVFVLLASTMHQCYVLYCDHWGKYALYNRAVEAAEAGDTQDLPRWLSRMREKARRNPACPAPETMAAGLVCVACEWGYPQTAQAVMVELGLSPAQLVWSQEGQPAVPFLEYLRQHPELFPATLAFLGENEKAA